MKPRKTRRRKTRKIENALGTIARCSCGCLFEVVRTLPKPHPSPVLDNGYDR